MPLYSEVDATFNLARPAEPIHKRRAHGTDAAKLRGAIDGPVEQLTGDRTTLHTKTRKWGCEAPEQLSSWLRPLWKP